MPSLTVSQPFGADARESVPAIFWRVILHCGVLAGLGLALMLWGVKELGVAIGALMFLAFAVSLVVHQVEPRWTPIRGTTFATRMGIYAAAAAAVVELGGIPGLVLVAMCVLLTPAVHRFGRRIVAEARKPHVLS